MSKFNLQSRILLLFVALLLAIQTVSFLLIRQAIEDNAKFTISSQLEVGERVFARSLKARGAGLAAATELLSNDFGFRSALASHDKPTIESALENQRIRAKAQAAYFFTPELDIAGIAGPALTEKGFSNIRTKFAGLAKSNTILLTDGEKIHQFALAPVKAPDLQGWIAIGFPVDASTLTDVKNISGFDVSLIIGNDDGTARMAATSFEDGSEAADMRAALETTMLSAKPWQSGYKSRSLAFMFPETTTIGLALYGSRTVGMIREGDSTTYSVLMQSIDKAREPYRKLQLTLIFLGLGGCATFAFGAWLLARSITRPIVELSRAVESLARGDYSAKLPAGSPGEVGELAFAFERMRQALGERETKIHKLAYWDTLTGLPNREKFRESLAELLDAKMKTTPMGLCSIALLDIDRIKNVNDTLGQHAGDEILKEVGRRINALNKPRNSLVARLTGDKFAVLLPGLDSKGAVEFADRIHSTFKFPVQIGEARIDLSAGIGICSFPEHATTVEATINRAEVAMYSAKQAKKKTICYDPRLDNSSEDSLSLLSELRDAIDNGELVLHYQAKANFSDGKILSAEALARWNHPVRGFMPPSAFIPFAEQTGFIGEITRWAVLETCKAVASFEGRGRPIKISANISTRDLLDPEFHASLKKSLATTGAKPGLLCLEITESSLMDNPERSLEAMAAIRRLGVELSIDDFGTGYSSLGYLRKMPINELKIDRVFIVGLTQGSAPDEKIVSSTIELAHGLGLRVVAEGVEDPSAFAKLRAAECDLAQGYGVSKPISEHDFLKLLLTWKPENMF